jgi:hypothetical protein
LDAATYGIKAISIVGRPIASRFESIVEKKSPRIRIDKEKEKATPLIATRKIRHATESNP